MNDLLDIDTPNLTEEMENILIADAEIGRQLNPLLERMSWPEKMAVGLHAYWLTDTSSAQICELQPKHGEFSEEVTEALDLIRELSPQSLCEIASEILLADWEVTIEDAPSTLIE